MTLREKVRLALIGTGADPWGTSVLELDQANVADDLPSPIQTGAASGLPFVIVRLGPKTPGQDWGNAGDSIDVWPYAEDETWQELDALCGIAIMRLDQQVVVQDDGVAYMLAYAGSPTQDTPVRQWDAYSRPVRFDSTKATWLAPLHPLAVALRTWTEHTWSDGEVQTDPTTWVPSAAAPAIYWRVTDLPRVRDNTDHFNIWVDQMRATLVCHVLAGDPDTRETWIGTLARRLPRAIIPYGSSYLVGQEITRADPNANQHSDGQLSVEVRYAVVTEAYAQQPGLIRHAEIRDGQQVGVSPTT